MVIYWPYFLKLEHTRCTLKMTTKAKVRVACWQQRRGHTFLAGLFVLLATLLLGAAIWLVADIGRIKREFEDVSILLEDCSARNNEFKFGEGETCLESHWVEI